MLDYRSLTTLSWHANDTLVLALTARQCAACSHSPSISLFVLQLLRQVGVLSPTLDCHLLLLFFLI